MVQDLAWTADNWTTDNYSASLFIHRLSVDNFITADAKFS
jgi:hypothetical protein